MKLFYFFILIFYSANLYAFPEDLSMGSVSFLLNGKKVFFFKKAKTILQKKANNKWKVIIGFKDDHPPVNFFITFTISEKALQNKQPISTRYNNLRFIYRSIDGDYLADKNYFYTPGDTYGNSLGNLRKSQKIATGVGAVENYKTGGSEFSVHLTPIYKNGFMIELQGRFFGKIRYSDNTQTDIISLENGEFRTEVIY